MKQQQLKGNNSIGVQMDPNASSLLGLKITGSFKYFPKPTYDEQNVRSMADMLSRHPCDSVMRMIIKVDNGRVII